jgi:lipopolysaccharide/colanic/teichoic acid biosynthesis glycosyltransferase
MSLVGPRPLVVEEERRMPAWARRRRAVRPGLTGLWQVRGRTSIPYEQMMALDCEYVRGWCLRLDLRLLVLTVPALLTRRGAN